MDKMYLAASAAFLAMNLRFSLLSRIDANDIAAAREGQLYEPAVSIKPWNSLLCRYRQH